ncbi:hypothetical protein Lal_00011762 [Lupinus albus]|uniref:DUF7733 domain-containing protein n=1 Tax=Lupinus albus TaxID=3870 RepID=A0A6A5NB63_LUPAL|nr:hypothetical protein Lalb_Chr06g0161231 [Lupinus albus]KAF1880703.1 hypothetical protein Lal_00011762 [Lupinus albus]
MSGGVGPTCSDISLPKEQEVEHKEQQDQSLKNLNKPNITNTPKKPTFLSFRQLNCLAVVIVLSASGMVSFEDFASVVLSSIYMFILSKVAFPTLHPSREPPIFNPKNKVLGFYVLIGAIIGLFVPIAYILEGIVEGDKEGIKAAAPHVFLLASQVFFEGVAFSDRFSSPIRAFVPIFYNSVRIFTLMEWLRNEIYKVNEKHNGSDRRIYVGRVLAVANMAFWSFNLFGFLLPIYLPKVFKQYYSGFKQKN